MKIKFIENLRNKFFLDRIVVFASLNTSFICALFIPMFKDLNFSTKEITLLLLAKKISRIFTDIPAGIFVDKFGPKKMFILGRIAKIISFILCLQGVNFYYFFIAMIFDGLSYSAIYGKVNVYIYNKLSQENKVNNYQNGIASYYLLIDGLIFLVHLIAKYLFEYGGYYFVIKMSILYAILSFIVIIKDKTIINHKKITTKTQSIKKMFSSILLLKKEILILTSIYGIGNYFAFQFGAIGSLILIDMKISPGNLSLIGGSMKIAMAANSIFLLFKNRTMNIQYSLFLLFILSGSSVLISIVYNPILFSIWMAIYIFLYIFIEVSIEKYIDIHITKNIRATINSIGWFVSSIIAISSISFLGYFGDILSYKKSFIIISSILSLLLFLLTLFFQIKTKQNNP